MWRLIIQTAYCQAFKMNNGVISRGFRIGDSDAGELVKVNPLLSEHMKLKLDLISKQPVSLETMDT